jgi:DMSO/TMAO reductase YedYZ molybdopterin-dependent catalytic subunit
MQPTNLKNQLARTRRKSPTVEQGWKMTKYGYYAGLILTLVMLLNSCAPAFSPPAGETEATEYQGQQLTPISRQGNNALLGTRNIDRVAYRLVVDGLVEKPLNLSYDDLRALPSENRLTTLDCVEGWNFNAKWTGPALATIFGQARVKPEALIAIFYSDDAREGYSSLDLDYIRSNNIIIALKLNDVTMPAERGFPFQVVAMSKFGYKWAKWVQRIELSSNAGFRGYWESRGYNNNADVGGPAFGK